MTSYPLSPTDQESTMRYLLSEKDGNETVLIEERRNGFDGYELGKFFSALSNEASLLDRGKAWIVFGADNNGKPLGTDALPTEESRRRIMQDIADSTTDGLTFDGIQEISIDGRRLLLFGIPVIPGTVVMFDGIAYGMENGKPVGLSLEKINRIQFRNYDWSEETVYATAGDLDAKALERARNLFKGKNPHLSQSVDSWTDTEFLTRLNLIVNGKVTNAAALLLGSEYGLPSQGGIPWISWILKDCEGKVKDYEHLGRPFLLSSERILSHLDGSRYDRAVLEEALKNAVMHSDYRIGKRIEIVEKKDDWVMFCNPGHSVPLKTDPIRSPTPRNRLLADTMYRLGLADNVGSGIGIMSDIQSGNGLPLPEYSLERSTVCMRLRLRTEVSEPYVPVTENDPVPEHHEEAPIPYSSHNVGPPLSDTQRRIVEFVLADGFASIKDMAVSLGIPERTVRYNLTALMESGHLSKEGRGSKVKWTVL